jgi:hypothetical protein
VIPVDVAIEEFAEVVDAAFLEQFHRAEAEGERAIVGFVLVVQVNEERLAVI